MNNQNKALTIKKFRSEAQDSPELQKRRLKWIKKIYSLFTEMKPTKTKGSSSGIFQNWIENYNPKPDFLEIYPFEDDIIKSKISDFQYPSKWINTRTKFKSETCAETDKLPFDNSIELMCDICLELIKKSIHFCMFYAEGQRSPHIRIYDFYEMEELKPHQREKAQAQFWRSIIPFRVHILDQGIWADDHYLQLEFAPHWKYGTPFNLLFEYIPQEEKCKN